MTTNLAVLFSGGGRTILNILDFIERGDLDANISQAIASRNGVEGIDRLIARGLDVSIARIDGETPSIGDQRVGAWLTHEKPDLICLCGYVRLLIIDPWMHGRVINIHPALLPNFGGKGMYGMHVHETVISNGAPQSGCTVHYVDEEYDHGPTIVQKTCLVDDSDTPQTLADKVFELECQAYPEAIAQVAMQLKV